MDTVPTWVLVPFFITILVLVLVLWWMTRQVDKARKEAIRFRAETAKEESETIAKTREGLKDAPLSDIADSISNDFKRTGGNG